MRAPWRSRSCRIWRAITSRKVWPSFTSSSDLAFVMPMLVPSPPFSLSTTTRSIADASPSPSSDSGRHLVERLDLALGHETLLARAQALLVARERLDRDLGQPLGAHLVGRLAHGRRS